MSTLNCLVCGKPLVSKENDCRRCGFHYLSTVGGSFEEGFYQQKPRADHYRTKTFLPKFVLGVTCYHWMDQNGTVVQKSRERLSFGTAADVLEKQTVWLDREFARLPGDGPMTVEVSILEQGAPERTVCFQLPAIREPELQQVGLCLEQGLMLRLKLKTVGSGTMVVSDAVKLFEV